jgi:acyl transferase domain-containing protein/acyl-CoA synthetase (AMP-forming)/AMP-acid ligase II/acyl carrier protein/ubiquinone/menaquinone biosynthesis C-methylase UbiE
MIRPLSDPHRFSTLVELLQHQAAIRTPQDGFTFMADGDSRDTHLSFAELDQRARVLGAYLQTLTLPGERAILMQPPGLEYLVSLFGCLYAGLVAVPVYPPRATRVDPRLKAVVDDCSATLALTTTPIYGRLDRCLENQPKLHSLRWINCESFPQEHLPRWQVPALDEETLAILQYTSGSTGSPKGVMLTHGNLLHNLAQIGRAFGIRYGDRGVTWLPPYHDMGLIGGLLEVLYAGGPTIFMSPATFVQKPLRWLQAISRNRATISGGPNFAYDLCVNAISPEERAQLDLSSWKVAFCGAEPISADTVDRFCATFKECGFRPEAFFPCYGLAEATLMVSGGPPGRSPVYMSVSRSQLEQHLVAVPTDDDDMKRLVSNGRPLPGQDVIVVNRETGAVCGEAEIGEIWVCGPSVAEGYWNKPDATEQTFQGRLPDDERTFLRTGDLGFLQHGELYITGRASDLIIVRGRNYYPQDIEAAVQACHGALRPVGGAAFACEAHGRQQIVVVHEVHRDCRNGDTAEVCAAIRQRVSEEFDLQVDAVVLVRTASIPKTSSGKIQRNETRRQYLAGELEVIGRWARDAQHGAGSASPANQPAAAGASQRSRQEIECWLVERLAKHLNLPAEQIEITQPFARYGIDSVTLVSVAGELQTWLGCEISPTLLYNEPNIAAVARSLASPAPHPIEKPSSQPARPVQEPVAIVGIGCRFPGADSPDEFWQLLRSGRSAIGPLPEDRRRLVPAEMAALQGGFLKNIDQFDAAHFGIAPQEAQYIDPQHRLLLETAWEALEEAGISPQTLAGEKVGVFVGISSPEYARLAANVPGAIGPYFGTGNALSMAAHRISYHFDFRGPSFAIDTACSSSLVAVHQACQALRNGECELALAGGVNLILSPELSRAFAQAQMLSPHARCKTFDAAADGYVRGEGCGLVVLKPLSAAQRDGDTIWAVIRGSAINQDGRSNGITAPNGTAQEALIRAALHNAAVLPGQISYVEAHGTGTVLGDPIEFNALKAALSETGSSGVPCHVGSVKTNIGHLESAAGIAALIKVALTLKHGEIPPHLHFENLNPHIKLDGTRFTIPTENLRFETNEPRFAGVSAFGFGGTNAHAVLESAPAAHASPQGIDRPVHVLTLSAKSSTALVETARRYADRLTEACSSSAGDICSSANTGRAKFPHRLAITGSSRKELRTRLAEFGQGQAGSGVHQGKASINSRPQVAFLFTGQGAQYVGMGRQLYETSPVFRRHLDRCAEILSGYLDRPLVSLLYGAAADENSLAQTAVTQPVLFALEYSLAQTLRAWGIVPAAVMGHSLGELVAATFAGAMSLEDGLKLTVERARLMQDLPHDGEMAVVFAPRDAVEQAAAAYQEHVSLAAINGPANVVIAGRADLVRRIVKKLADRGYESRQLHVSHAFHSPLMDPMLPELEYVAQQIRFTRPALPLVSNVTGGVLNEAPSAGHWRRHVRQAVQFAAGMETLARLGCQVFVEIGPSATLIGMGATCVAGDHLAWLPTLKKGHDDWRVLLDSVAELHVRGVEIDWAAFDRDYTRRRVSLPTCVFERESFWLPLAPQADTGLPQMAATSHTSGVPAAPATTPAAHEHKTPAPSTANELLASLSQQLAPLADALYVEQNLPRFEALEGQLDRLVAAYAAEALQKLGADLRAGVVLTEAALMNRLGIAAGYRRLLGRLLAILGEDGWLERNGSGWVVARQVLPPSPAALLEKLTAQFPTCTAELTLASRCGQALADVLRGTQDPLSILFPEGSSELVEALYQNSPLARYNNSLVQQVVAQLVARRPADQPLRVLEIGAGTGGTTAYVLPQLPADRTEYLFTDVSRLFLHQASEKFSGYGFIRFEQLDIERNPAEQGFTATYDLVLACNVLHATADLRSSLRHAAELLAPGGQLVLLEGARPQRLLDLVFGLTPGWWRFTDTDLRPAHALVSREKWLQILAQTGFAAALALPENVDASSSRSAQVVLVAGGLPAKANRPLPGSSAPSPSVAATSCQPQIAAPASRSTMVIEAPSRQTLLQADPQQRRTLVETYLRQSVAVVLGLKPEKVDLEQPVNNLGLDSLMAIQLKNRIESELKVSVPMVALLSGLSVQGLIEKALEQIAEEAPAGEGKEVAPAVSADPLAAANVNLDLDGLSEEELDLVLGALLTESTQTA